ncbi:MAG TPA: Uma2 family endonuclease [Acidobacteriota bacterium]
MQAATALPARRRFTVDEFEHLAEVGILDEDDRVELLDGDIVEMTPISSQHAGGVNALIAIYAGRLGDRAVVAAQNPVRLDDFNEPQPDLCLLRPREDRYRRSHPGAGDVLLLIEVAHTSQPYDQGIKAPLYSRYGVRETWVVDVDESTVHVFRDPSPAGYRSHEQLRPGETVAPEAFPEVLVEVAEIVGAP